MLACLLDKLIASNWHFFSVSGLKDEKLTKKQIYMKPEICKLYSRVFWIFLPNVIKIDPYNFELHHFKVFLRHSVLPCQLLWWRQYIISILTYILLLKSLLSWLSWFFFVLQVLWSVKCYWRKIADCREPGWLVRRCK